MMPIFNTSVIQQCHRGSALFDVCLPSRCPLSLSRQRQCDQCHSQRQLMTSSRCHQLWLPSRVGCMQTTIQVNRLRLSMVLRLHQHNIGYTADGFYRSDDPTNSVKALKEGG